MVDMHMGQHQRLKPGYIEIDGQIPGTGAARPGIPALKKTAIDQHRRAIAHNPLMGRAGDTADSTVVPHKRKGPGGALS